MVLSPSPTTVTACSSGRPTTAIRRHRPHAVRPLPQPCRAALPSSLPSTIGRWVFLPWTMGFARRRSTVAGSRPPSCCLTAPLPIYRAAYCSSAAGHLCSTSCTRRRCPPSLGTKISPATMAVGLGKKVVEHQSRCSDGAQGTVYL
ncbi:hypothetical protein ACLOJK_027495, partial [Asimina triloba]